MRQPLVVLGGLLVVALYGVMTVSFAVHFADVWRTSMDLAAYLDAIGASYGCCGLVAGVLLLVRHPVARTAAGLAAAMTWLAAALPVRATLLYGGGGTLQIAIAMVVVAVAATAAWFALPGKRRPIAW